MLRLPAGAPFSSQHPCCAHPACSLFVRFLHMASPYVAGHRGRTFVVVIPGEVGAASPLPAAMGRGLPPAPAARLPAELSMRVAGA